MDKMNRNCIEGIFEYRYRIHGTYAGQSIIVFPHFQTVFITSSNLLMI